MDSPLAPRPIAPGIRTPRVTRANRDRKGKRGAFRDELHREGPDGPEPRPAPPGQAPAPKRPREGGGPGRLLDIEA